MNQSFAEWNKTIAEAIRAVGTREFPKQITAALEALVDFDILMVFAYSGSEKPVCHHHNMDDKRAETVIEAYARGPYLLDPFYAAATDPAVSGVHRLKDMAPDHFYSSEYYRQHYVLTDIRDEVGVFCHPEEGTGLVISFTRSVNARAFGLRDLRSIRDAGPLIQLLCERHWKQVDAPSAIKTSNATQPSAINDTLDRMTNGILTPREIEITSLILKGYSNSAIAARLTISAGTVKIHRKNIYQKLEISSQSELFALFIQELSGTSTSR